MAKCIDSDYYKTTTVNVKEDCNVSGLYLKMCAFQYFWKLLD